MESFGNNASYQPPPYSQHREDEGYEWNYQDHYEPSNEEMSYGWNHDYQYEQMEYGWNPQYQHEPSNEKNDYMKEYGYHQESFNPNLYCHDEYQSEYIENGRDNYGDISNSAPSLENDVNAILGRLAAYMRRHDGQIGIRQSVERENEEVFDDEDMVQEGEVLNDLPEECDSFDQHQEEEIIQDTEDVLDAQIPLQEEIEEVPKDEDMTPEGEIMDVSHMAFEIVVEHQDELILAQQQSPAGEEVKEIIQLPENALDEDALASMVAVMNEKTLRYNNASTNETNKEENEVFQLYELPQKELHEDEEVGQKVPRSPTPRSRYSQGPRKRLEWRIKHKWKEKLRNV